MHRSWRFIVALAMATGIALGPGQPEESLAASTILAGDHGVAGGLCVGTACGANETFIQPVDLGIAKIKGASPVLMFDDSGAGGPFRWVFGGYPEVFFLSTNDGTTDRTPLLIRPLAPDNSLTITNSGNVGMGWAPANNALDIRRNVPNGDIFASIGVDPQTGPSFNYGYGGGTFGVGAGFFNARPAPGSSAPNPSIRFMTANVQGMILDNQQFLGLGVAGFDPAHPIHHQASGAHLTTGGTWTDVSSRAAKQDIAALDTADAYATLAGLEPVHYRYIADAADPRLGFIAEDVPELVATPDRTGLSAMDIVAVLTKVVQEQEKRIAGQDEHARAQDAVIAELLARVAALEAAR